MTSEQAGRRSRRGGLGAAGAPLSGRGSRGSSRRGSAPRPAPPAPPGRSGAEPPRGGAAGGRAVPPPPTPPHSRAAPSRLVAAAARRSSAQQVGRPGSAPFRSVPHPPPAAPGSRLGPLTRLGHGDTPPTPPGGPPVPPDSPPPPGSARSRLPPTPLFRLPPVPRPAAGGCPSAGASVPEGGGDRAGVGGRSLNSGDALRPPRNPRPRSGWGHFGSKSGVAGGAGAEQGSAGRDAGEQDPHGWDLAVGLVPFSGLRGIAWWEIRARRGVVWRGAPSFVLCGCPHGPRGVPQEVRARVCARQGVGWHRGGCVGTGFGWCWGAWAWTQGGTCVTCPCPPGGCSGWGQRGGSDAEVLQTRVLCERPGGRQQGNMAWVGRADPPGVSPAELGWTGLSQAKLCCDVLGCAVLSHAVLYGGAVLYQAVPCCTKPCHAVPSRAVPYQAVPCRWELPGSSGKSDAFPSSLTVGSHEEGGESWTSPQTLVPPTKVALGAAGA